MAEAGGSCDRRAWRFFSLRLHDSSGIRDLLALKLHCPELSQLFVCEASALLSYSLKFCQRPGMDTWASLSASDRTSFQVLDCCRPRLRDVPCSCVSVTCAQALESYYLITGLALMHEHAQMHYTQYTHATPHTGTHALHARTHARTTRTHYTHARTTSRALHALHVHTHTCRRYMHALPLRSHCSLARMYARTHVRMQAHTHYMHVRTHCMYVRTHCRVCAYT